MGFIKDIIKEFATNNQESQHLAVETTFDNVCKVLHNCFQKLDNIPTQEADKRELFLEIDNELCNAKNTLFKRCCNEIGYHESQRAFCIYRDFLAEYNETVKRYNHIVGDNFETELRHIIEEIFTLQDKLMPINNENITQHSEYHKYNEEYYKKIEQLEEKRRDVLRGIK